MSWKKNLFDWNNARAFLVTAEEGSFSAAARTLGMAQPTLGRQVAALEAELGVTLFERLPHGLELTQTGLELVDHVRSMGKAASDFSITASGQSQQIDGSVSISVSELDAMVYLPKALSILRRQEPGIDVDILVTNNVSDLKSREADIAIRNFRPTQTDFIVRKLKDVDVYLYGTQEYLDNFPTPKKPSDIKGLEFIRFSRSDHVDPFQDFLSEKGYVVNKKSFPLYTDNQLLQIELVKQHLGLGVFPVEYGDSITELIRAFPAFGPVIQIPLWLVCHRELHTSLRVRKVFDILVKHITQTD
ncbi:LysR family transcriptional regulator [Marinomonas transparens]|uniref:LysR family transcriptional regulator n=1 Tax=Marinomonas transparens TaxID=2795388 RepID=A0A934JYJ9_9GAMM|nr:LysR family transcriptional regulator [Marinomonas transparens]MBJ7539600.1 LysR family transcriptional regulator [Marinomonas transparens]